MDIERGGPTGHLDTLDADAVCQVCETVNPEGTLLCKTCGNNLRDQRARRIASGAFAAESEATPSRSRFLRAALTVFGLLLIVWTGLNVGNIENLLIASQLDNNVRADAFWSGTHRALYDGLLRQLEANPITPEEIVQAQTSRAPLEKYEGRFVLKPSADSRAPMIGQAIARQEEDTIYFVAKLERGDVEIRGAIPASSSENLLTAPAPSEGSPAPAACVRIGEEYLIGYGFAQNNGDGSLKCYAQQRAGEEVKSSPHIAIAYHIPETVTR
ncbi:MAG: hypothetical protein HY706_02200 [Candidatus Hydrogenedentes bacterium]|nr:hypothetical protein [Candidatus Hydrogenedentota bacterium]